MVALVNGIGLYFSSFFNVLSDNKETFIDNKGNVYFFNKNSLLFNSNLIDHLQERNYKLLFNSNLSSIVYFRRYNYRIAI